MNISNAEQMLLEILWQQNPLTVGQIIERAQLENDWHENTIKTMLTRMVSKKILQRDKDGKRYFYSPCVTKKELLNEQTSGFLARFFDGKMAPLVAHFVDNKQISDTEIEEIESILAKLKKSRG